MSEGYAGLPPYYTQSSDPVTPNFGFSLKGMDPIIAENFVLADAAIGGGGSIKVNGSVVSNPNFNGSTPAAPGGNTNVTFQVDGSGNISAYVSSSGGGAVSSVFGRTGAVVATASDYSSVPNLTLGDGAFLSSIQFTTSQQGILIAAPKAITVQTNAFSLLNLGDTAGHPTFSLASGGTVSLSTDITGATLTIAGTALNITATTATAPTPTTADNSTKIATTAFVKAQGYITTSAVTSVFTRTGAVVAAANDYAAVPNLTLGDGILSNNIIFNTATAGLTITGFRFATMQTNQLGSLSIGDASAHTNFSLTGGGTVTLSTDTAGNNLTIAGTLSTFSGAVKIGGVLQDGAGSHGTSGQILTSTVTGVAWGAATGYTNTPPVGAGFWSWYYFDAPLASTARTAMSTILADAAAGGFVGYIMYIPETVVISHLTYDMTTVVAGGTFDVGLYKQAGGANSLVASTGGVSTATGGANTPNTVALTQGTVTLTPGYYYFAMTCSTTTTCILLCWSNMASLDGASIFQNRSASAATSNMVFATGASAGVLPTTMPTWSKYTVSHGVTPPCVYFCN